jgi:hypothetical protein
MAGLEADHVVVASFGGVYIAPEGTPAPADLAPLAAPWVNVGYVGEDGVTFTLSRDSQDIMAWQSAEPVRRLITAEPKELAFELLEFDPESVKLAFRGGQVAVTGVAPNEIAVYTPPDAAAGAINAVCIEWEDLGSTWRFFAKRSEISGDVEFTLSRTDAIRLPLTLAVLAADAPSWQIMSDDDSWVSGAAAFAAPAGAPDESWTVAELQAAATAAGLPTSGTKAELLERLTEAATAPAAA